MQKCSLFVLLMNNVNSFNKIVLMVVVVALASMLRNIFSFTDLYHLNANAKANLECTFIKLHNFNFGTQIILAIHRPPDSNLDLILRGCAAVIITIKQYKTEYLLAGDYNIDSLKHDLHEPTDSL